MFSAPCAKLYTHSGLSLPSSELNCGFILMHTVIMGCAGTANICIMERRKKERKKEKKKGTKI